MDTIIGVVVMVAISVLMGWLENRKKDASAPEKPKRRQPVRPAKAQAVQQMVKPKPQHKPKQQPKPKAHPKPAVAAAPVLPEEGVRVTSDADLTLNDLTSLSDTTGTANDGAGLPPLPAGDLRAAVIWGEILNRKF